MRRSGEVLRIAPNWNNQDGFRSFHLIHPDLKPYYDFGAIETTFGLSEDTFLGGDRRLSRISLPKASWAGERITQRALIAFLDFINFTDLDCLVTIRTWDRQAFSDYNATLSYLPPDNLYTTFCEAGDFLFTFSDLVAL